MTMMMSQSKDQFERKAEQEWELSPVVNILQKRIDTTTRKKVRKHIYTNGSQNRCNETSIKMHVHSVLNKIDRNDVLLSSPSNCKHVGNTSFSALKYVGEMIFTQASSTYDLERLQPHENKTGVQEDNILVYPTRIPDIEITELDLSLDRKKDIQLDNYDEVLFSEKEVYNPESEQSECTEKNEELIKCRSSNVSEASDEESSYSTSSFISEESED